MSTQGKHPHIDQPTDEQLTGLLHEKDPVIRELYFEVHRLVVYTLPDIKYSVDCVDGGMGYGARQYGYNGWGLAALSAYTKWVSLFFLHGVDLDDPKGLLEGTGKKMRHVKIRSPEQFEQHRGALKALIEAASQLHV